MVDYLKRDVFSSLLFLSGEERTSLQTPIKTLIDGMIEKEDYSDALSLSLFRKGLLFTTKSVVEKKLAGNRKTRKRHKELQNLRIKLNDCITFEDSLKIPELTLKISQLERELNHTLTNNDEIYRTIDKNVGKVVGNLSDEQIAIDFLRYLSGDSISYGAFIIRNSVTSRFISIGPENEISKTPFLVWEKLKVEISNESEVYFCPDGILNNIGIEFLKDADGVPMSQKYNLHRVFHLADIQPHEGIGDKVVAIGVSDHNSPIGDAETIDRGTMTDLPNVAYEMRLIGQRLGSNSLTMLFNDDATEIEFKRLGGTDLSSLHISTHGIYRDYGSLSASAGNPDDDDYHIAQRVLRADKASLSGLILRQGNLSWKSKQILEENDDILTSEEIENMTFPNLHLTVLSACDSGLGDIDSEGVWGLQRAFRIAGSKSLICSLKRIDDYWTAQFMDAFYEYAGQGKSIYESFHHAQKGLFEAEPNNPDIWSSFILIE